VDRFIPAVMDQHSSAIDQATLARFLTEGFFLSHVKRMRKLYSERRDFFIEQFHKVLGDHFVLQIETGRRLLNSSRIADQPIPAGETVLGVTGTEQKSIAPRGFLPTFHFAFKG